ncbi:hypothetical protein [Streptomyces microflavus]|uniref:hypothetical protein n=1 Tax=Streptomyces microflavus TaxID=1919 RepID=UPI00341CF436
MSDFPPGVLPTLQHALVFNLLDAYRRVGHDLPFCDLYPDLIRALKWVHAQDPETAVSVVWNTLEHLAGHTQTEGGPATEAAARCLRFSLTRTTPPFGEWSEEQADRFVTAALIKS